MYFIDRYLGTCFVTAAFKKGIACELKIKYKNKHKEYIHMISTVKDISRVPLSNTTLTVSIHYFIYLYVLQRMVIVVHMKLNHLYLEL